MPKFIVHAYFEIEAENATQAALNAFSTENNSEVRDVTVQQVN